MFMRRFIGGLLRHGSHNFFACINHSNYTRGASKFVSKRPKSTLAIKFDESVNLLPLRDAVRYTEFNKKVTAADFKVMGII